MLLNKAVNMLCIIPRNSVQASGLNNTKVVLHKAMLIVNTGFIECITFINTVYQSSRYMTQNISEDFLNLKNSTFVSNIY